jgi:hypothetical protein
MIGVGVGEEAAQPGTWPRSVLCSVFCGLWSVVYLVRETDGPSRPLVSVLTAECGLGARCSARLQDSRSEL